MSLIYGKFLRVFSTGDKGGVPAPSSTNVTKKALLQADATWSSDIRAESVSATGGVGTSSNLVFQVWDSFTTISLRSGNGSDLGEIATVNYADGDIGLTATTGKLFIGSGGTDRVQFNCVMSIRADQYNGVTTPSHYVGGFGAIWGGTDGKLYYKNQSNTVYDLTATGTASVTQATVAFTDGDTRKRVTITDAAVTATSKIVMSIVRANFDDTDAAANFTYRAEVVKRSTGSFDVVVFCDSFGDDATELVPNETINLHYILG
jgi:hypothetical protein